MVLTAEQSAEKSLAALDRVGRDIRRAMLSALPCASEQYLTISMPGHVIDTKRGGQFVKSETPSAGELHQIRVSEARLVDSMIPLDTVMLGPTGKSVVRSYLAALDYLIPIDSEVRLPSMTPRETTEKPSNYRTAMDYLRKPIAGPGESTAVTAPGDTHRKTVVDVYVEKQSEYTKAQIAWDAVQDRNAEDLQRNQGMSADELEKRQSRMRTAKYELQARWMDWVVNGDKIIVDHHFAVVDISTVMARIEASKEATRAANILDLVNGTQWAQVILEPKDWAMYCRQKALGWSSRNPLSPAVIELEIKRLLNLKAAYEGYLEGSIGKLPSDGTAPPADPSVTSGEEEDIRDINKMKAELDVLRKKANTADTETISKKEKELEAKKQILADKQKGNKDKAILKALDAASAKGMNTSLSKKIKELDLELTRLRGHLAESTAGFQRGVDTIIGVQETQAGKNASSTASSSTTSSSTTEGTTNPPGSTVPQLEYVMSGQQDAGADKNLLTGGGAQSPQESDPWTKIVFGSSNDATNSENTEKSMSADAKAKIGGMWWGVEASTSYSTASKELRQESANHKISGSFSALLVKITRPWLHSELFSDYEIDAPQNPKMSPGPKQFKDWLAARNETELGKFGMFPAYPTSFIVAADVELEITCGQSFASSFMASTTTDSSLGIRYGPWSASASANLKTSSTTSNQRMESTATGMKLSFQSPQIIGWVSEILPELPRNKNPLAPGGLVGAPMNLFRN